MIEFKHGFDRFELSFRGRRVLLHAPERPCITLGSAEGIFKMNHGSFKIREKNAVREPLAAFLTVKEGPKKVVIDFGKLTAVFAVVKERLEMSFSCPDARMNRFQITLCAGPEERIYGCGEQYTHLDLRGRRVPLWVEEQGVGRGRDLITLLAELAYGAGGTWYTTYFPQPTFVSSANWFCHAESSCYALFDFTRKDEHRLSFWGVPGKIVIDKRGTAPEVLRSLTGFLGRQPALPAWACNGVWLGVQGGKEIVGKKLKDALDAGVRVGALWAQDWCGRRVTSFGKQLMWNWRFDKGMYPGLPSYIKSLDMMKIKFLGYINPFLALEGDLYREASAKGYLVLKGDGSEYHVTITTFPAAIVDITNTEAVKWIKGVIKNNMIKTGLAGWMADFGEYLPVDSVLHSGESAENFHNKFAPLWARINHEAVKEAGKAGKVLFFSRAGYTGSSRHSPLIWAGDQLVNWSMDDGLATVIPAGLSLGFSGIGLHHSDIGGYTTVTWIKRTKELFMRWAEHAAFTVVMRTHEGNRPDDNWQFNSDEETLRHFAKMSRVYAALAPYIKETVREYVKSGLPAMRHPWIHYEGDAVLHKIKYQYLFGRDLLVAPVYKPKRKRWNVYLPGDRWIHLWTGKEYGKGRHTVPSPLGEPPVFYRADSKYVRLFEKIGTDA